MASGLPNPRANDSNMSLTIKSACKNKDDSDKDVVGSLVIGKCEGVNIHAIIELKGDERRISLYSHIWTSKTPYKHHASR
jgi:hypothetical protein